MALYDYVVNRFSAPGATIAEFTAGSGTLAATCALKPRLRDRKGAYLPCDGGVALQRGGESLSVSLTYDFPLRTSTT